MPEPVDMQKALELAHGVVIQSEAGKRKRAVVSTELLIARALIERMERYDALKKAVERLPHEPGCCHRIEWPFNFDCNCAKSLK